MSRMETVLEEIEKKIERLEIACAGLYMEMADGKKRTCRLEEYTRMLDMQPRGSEAGRVVAYVNAKLAKMYWYHETDLPAFWAGWRPVADERADEPVHYSGGAFGMLALREQHRMQQRGSEY